MQSLFCLSLGDFSPAMQIGGTHNCSNGAVTLLPLTTSALLTRWQRSLLQSGTATVVWEAIVAQLLPPVLTVCTFGYKLLPELGCFWLRFSNLNVSLVFRISISIFQCVHAANNCEIKMFTSLVCFICYLLFAICCLALWSNLAMWQDKSSSRVSD